MTNWMTSVGCTVKKGLSEVALFKLRHEQWRSHLSQGLSEEYLRQEI